MLCKGRLAILKLELGMWNEEFGISKDKNIENTIKFVGLHSGPSVGFASASLQTLYQSIFRWDEHEIAVRIQAIVVGDECLVVAYFEYAVFRADHEAGIFDGDSDCLFH